MIWAAAWAIQISTQVPVAWLPLQLPVNILGKAVDYGSFPWEAQIKFLAPAFSFAHLGQWSHWRMNQQIEYLPLCPLLSVPFSFSLYSSFSPSLSHSLALCLCTFVCVIWPFKYGNIIFIHGKCNLKIIYSCMKVSEYSNLKLCCSFLLSFLQSHSIL